MEHQYTNQHFNYQQLNNNFPNNSDETLSFKKISNTDLIEDFNKIQRNEQLKKEKEQQEFKDYQEKQKFINTLRSNFSNIRYTFPIPTQIESLFRLSNEDIYNYFKYTYIFSDKRIIKLIEDFLVYKLMFGFNIEKNKYIDYTKSTEDNIIPISPYKFIGRLIKKRALMFESRSDKYKLRDNTTGYDGWKYIGTDYEKPPLLMNDYLTYDELEISAYLCMSVYTPFINKCNNRNKATDDGDDHERNGIVVCQTAPRLDKSNIMEWRFMIIDPAQNTIDNGYGPNNETMYGVYMKLWAKFYGVDYFPLYEEILTKNTGPSDVYIDPVTGNKLLNRYIKLPNYKDIYLDSFLYKKRIRIIAELFLKEANIRAMNSSKKAFCYVVGLGLGLESSNPGLSHWCVTELQKKFMLDVYLDILETEKFEYISDIYLSKFVDHLEQEIEIPTYINGINILNSRDHKYMYPSENLRDPTKLLVRNTEWNSNSYIGNEYFENNLSNSDASITACSCYASIIGNPDINKFEKVYLY